MMCTSRLLDGAVCVPWVYDFRFFDGWMSPVSTTGLLCLSGTAAAIDESAVQEEFEPLSVHPSLFKMAVIVAGRPTSPKASIARVEASILQVQVHMCEAPTAPLQTAAPRMPRYSPKLREGSKPG